MQKQEAGLLNSQRDEWAAILLLRATPPHDSACDPMSDPVPKCADRVTGGASRLRMVAGHDDLSILWLELELAKGMKIVVVVGL